MKKLLILLLLVGIAFVSYLASDTENLPQKEIVREIKPKIPTVVITPKEICKEKDLVYCARYAIHHFLPDAVFPVYPDISYQIIDGEDNYYAVTGNLIIKGKRKSWFVELFWRVNSDEFTAKHIIVENQTLLNGY